MDENNSFHNRQMNEQEIQQFLVDGLPLQDFLLRGGTAPPDEASRILMERMGLPETIIALWVDLSKRPDLLQAFSILQGTAYESECNWTYLSEDQKEACYFVLHVHIKKPTQIHFHIPIRAADARWGEILDTISLMRAGVIIPITLYAGPAPDWQTMIEQLEPAQVSKQLKQSSRGDLTLTLSREAVRDMSEHYDTWRERFRSEELPPSLRGDIPLRFLIADVRGLTLSELAESLIEIAKQMQQITPQFPDPLQGGMRIDGQVPVRSQYRSSAPLSFAITSVEN